MPACHMTCHCFDLSRDLSLIAGLASAPPPVPDRGRTSSVSTNVNSINCIDGLPLAVGQEMSDGLEKKVSCVARDIFLV